MPREKAQAVTAARPKVPMRRLGADCFVVAMKRGNARGAKRGAGHRHLDRVNWQREEPDNQWKAAAFARWHEPYEPRGSRTVLWGSGRNSLGLLGIRVGRAMSVCRLRPRLRTYGCDAANRRFGPCVDGSKLARRIFTSQAWSVQPCVRPLSAVHMTAGHNALRGSGPGH